MKIILNTTYATNHSIIISGDDSIHNGTIATIAVYCPDIRGLEELWREKITIHWHLHCSVVGRRLVRIS